MIRPACLLLVSIFLFFSGVNAQKIGASGIDYEWSSAPLLNDGQINNEVINFFAYGSFYAATTKTNKPRAICSGYHLTVSDKEQVMPVTVGKNNWGIVKINNLGREVWHFNGSSGDLLGSA